MSESFDLCTVIFGGHGWRTLPSGGGMPQRKCWRCGQVRQIGWQPYDPGEDLTDEETVASREFVFGLTEKIVRLEAENEILRRGFRASRRKIAMYRTNSSRLPEWCHAALAAAVKIEPSVTEAGDKTNE